MCQRDRADQVDLLNEEIAFVRCLMKGILRVLFFISGCALGVNGALAQCSCLNPNITAFEEFKKSEAVFIGEVLASDIVEKPAGKIRGDVYDMEIKFKVKKVWRKSLQEEVSVRFLVHGCIRDFDKGTEHLVYVHNDDKGRLRMYCCCTRSRLLVDAAEDVGEFKARGEEPKPIIVNKKNVRYWSN